MLPPGPLPLAAGLAGVTQEAGDEAEADAGVPPAISMDGVELWWPNADAPVLTVNRLAIPPGASVAVFGSVASGKSSLLLGLLSGERASQPGGQRLHRRAHGAGAGALAAGRRAEGS